MVWTLTLDWYLAVSQTVQCGKNGNIGMSALSLLKGDTMSQVLVLQKEGGRNSLDLMAIIN